MKTEQSSRFGPLLVRHRRAAGLTQEELAEQAGLSVRAISDIERSVRRPRRDTADLLLTALQLSPEERARFELAARILPDLAASLTHVQAPQGGSFLGSVPSGPLVGRHEELRRTLSRVSAAAGGSGELVMVVGEPGVGKTRFAQEVAQQARDGGFLVATGRCYEEEQTTPFYPFLEALTIAYASATESVRAEAPTRWPFLGMLLPDGSSAFQRPMNDGQLDEHRLFRNVSGFLQAVAGVMPVAIVLDDLHWADSATLKLILHLARHTRSYRVFLLGSYRDIDVNRQHPLERALVDLNRERLMERVVLHRPDQPGTGALIEAVLGEVDDLDQLTTLVHEATGGNPFFVHEVLRALVQRGDLYEHDGRWLLRDINEIRVPETVQAAARERLWRLSRNTQDVLFEASVLGQAFAFDDLWGMGHRREEDIERALEEAAEAGLIRETDEDGYVFVHALTHRALYAELSHRRRRRLHRAAGESLERLPPRARRQRVAELAWHFLKGNDDERGVRYALQAGDRALEAFAYSEAEQYFRTVLELTAALGSGGNAAKDEMRGVEAEAFGKLGRVLNIVHRYDEALATLERAAGLYRLMGDAAREGRCVAEIGWIHRARGTVEEGVTRIQPFLRSLEEPNAPEVPSYILSALYMGLARLYFRLHMYEEEVVAVERAVDLARGDDVTRAVAEALKGRALMSLGRRETAREVLEGAIARAAAAGQIGSMSVALENLGEIYRDRGEFRQSKALFQRSVDAAEQTQVPTRIAWSTCKLGQISFLLGNWSEAGCSFERAAEVFASVDEPQPAGYVALFSEHLSLARGWSQSSEQRLQTIIALADSARDLWALRYAHLLLAEQDLLEGRPESATARLEPLLDRPGIEEPQVTLVLPTLAVAYVEMGKEGEAEDLLARSVKRAADQSHRLSLWNLVRARGMLRARQERWDEASADFEEAVSMTDSMPYPYAEGRVRYEYGKMHARQGDLQAARRQLRTALGIFRRLGARPYVERTERELENC